MHPFEHLCHCGKTRITPPLLVLRSQRDLLISSSLVDMPNQVRKDLHCVDTESFPYVYEENATVELTSSDGLVRCNVYRPKSTDKVPVLVTYGPYGKDAPYKE